MTRHYSIPERIENETTTLLATDPTIWKTYKQVVVDG